MPRGVSSAERAQRFMALLGQLTPGAKLSIAALAEEIGTTEADLTSDLETFAACGVAPYSPDTLLPLIIDDGIVEVWGELPAVRGPIRLSAAEAQALAAALQAAGFATTDPLTARLVEAAAGLSFDPGELAATLRSASTGHDAGVFETLSLAAAEQGVVGIDYLKSGADASSCREIEPIQLYLERGAWYLTAWCRLAGDWRTFRVDRILSATRTGDTFTERLSAPRVASAFSADDLPKARLRFAAAADFSERDWPGAAVKDRADDGILIVDVPYSGTEWVARQVVARLGAVTALEPAEVVDAVVGLAREELAKLEG